METVVSRWHQTGYARGAVPVTITRCPATGCVNSTHGNNKNALRHHILKTR